MFSYNNGLYGGMVLPQQPRCNIVYVLTLLLRSTGCALSYTTTGAKTRRVPRARGGEGRAWDARPCFAVVILSVRHALHNDTLQRWLNSAVVGSHVCQRNYFKIPRIAKIVTEVTGVFLFGASCNCCFCNNRLYLTSSKVSAAVKCVYVCLRVFVSRPEQNV